MQAKTRYCACGKPRPDDRGFCTFCGKSTRRLERELCDYSAAELLGFIEVWQSSQSEVEMQVQFGQWLNLHHGLTGMEISLKQIRRIASQLTKRGIELDWLPPTPPPKSEIILDWVKLAVAWTESKTVKSVFEATGYSYELILAAVNYLRINGIPLPELPLGYTPYVNNNPKVLGATVTTGQNASLDWIRHGASPRDYARKLKGGHYEDLKGRKLAISRDQYAQVMFACRKLRSATKKMGKLVDGE